MASGSLLGVDGSADPGPGHDGPRPFLSRAQMIGLRALLVLYVATLVLMAATNVPAVGRMVFRLSSDHLWVGLTVGIMLVTSLLTFVVLLWMSLHHFRGGHAGARPATWWLWVIVLLNVAGVVAYYLRIIEPEQKMLLRAGPPA